MGKTNKDLPCSDNLGLHCFLWEERTLDFDISRWTIISTVKKVEIDGVYNKNLFLLFTNFLCCWSIVRTILKSLSFKKKFNQLTLSRIQIGHNFLNSGEREIFQLICWISFFHWQGISKHLKCHSEPRILNFCGFLRYISPQSGAQSVCDLLS